MKYLLRLTLVTSIAGCIAAAAPSIYAEGLQITPILQDSPALMMHSGQGYLGIRVNDLDNDRAQALKLKDSRGVEVIELDHDGPASKAGLRLHDVILQMNGQTIENEEQFRRLLRDIPPGKSAGFIVSRDGVVFNMNVQLVDQAALSQQAWPRPYSAYEPSLPPPPGGQGLVVGPGGPNGLGPGPRHVDQNHSFIHWPMMGTSGSLPAVGAAVTPINAQLATSFGVKNGLKIDSVTDGTPAANAGLKAGDVILKVNKTETKSWNDWARALRANEGTSVPITIMRDHKQQILTLTF